MTTSTQIFESQMLSLECFVDKWMAYGLLFFIVMIIHVVIVMAMTTIMCHIKLKFTKIKGEIEKYDEKKIEYSLSAHRIGETKVSSMIIMRLCYYQYNEASELHFSQNR